MAPLEIEAKANLRKATAALYVTFARYGPRAPARECADCFRPGDFERLHGKPPRELGAGDLTRYALEAVTTWVDAKHFKYFLPRLFELQAFDPAWPVDPEMLIGKLEYAAWSGWPLSEQAAVEAYLLALWQFTLSAFPAAREADECLCAVGRVVDDLRPFLEAWRHHPAATGRRHLVWFIDDNAGALLETGRLANPFWEGREGPMRQVRDWLLDPRTAALLEPALCPNHVESLVGELSSAGELLAGLRRRLKAPEKTSHKTAHSA